MAKIRRNADGTIGLGRNKSWAARQASAPQQPKAAKKSAKKPAGKTTHTAAEKTARAAQAKAVKSGASKRAKRHLASQYVNFDKTGAFRGYKKSAPSGYVYMPGSRYLSNVKNLRLVDGLSSAEQKKFVRQNRADVERALQAASKAGAFKDFGMNRRLGDYYAADFNLEKGGAKFAQKMKDYFKHPSMMHVPRLRAGRGHAGRRARAAWSFAFGQDGRKR